MLDASGEAGRPPIDWRTFEDLWKKVEQFWELSEKFSDWEVLDPNIETILELTWWLFERVMPMLF